MSRSGIPIIGYTLLILSIVVLAGFLSVSFTAVLYLLTGVLIALFLRRIAPVLKSKFLALPTWRKAIIVVGPILIAVFSCLLYLTSFSMGITPGPCQEKDGTWLETNLSEYQAVIEPVEFSEGTFMLSEKATFHIERLTCQNNEFNMEFIEGDTVSIPERQIQSFPKGFLVREIRITPLEGTKASGTTYALGSEALSIELRDFPRSGFYEARDVAEPKISPYLDTETVTWKVPPSRADIRFAYIASPFYSWRSILMPFIALSAQGQWVIALLGLIVTGVIVPIVQPILLDAAKTRISSLFKKEEKKKKVKKSAKKKS